MEKNILLLCVSLFPVKKENGKIVEPDVASYYFLDEKNEKYTEKISDKWYEFKGIMTNEAPSKGVIKYLYDQNRRLDKIVAIVSDRVEQNIEGRDISHYEYFKNAIYNYISEEISEDYFCGYNPDSLFEVVKINDITDEDAVIKASIDVATKIPEIKGNITDVNLFIDFNGGQRYIPFMLWNIASMMEIRGVKIEKTLTMNFENKENGHVLMRSMNPVFKIEELTSGINEYKKYGRADGLKKYFGKCDNSGINYAMNILIDFADNLLLCRTAYITNENKRKKLKECLEKDYSSYKDSYGILFSYFIKDIKDSYENLLEDNSPLNVIRWYIDNSYVPQALTFCEARLPAYFVENGIFAPVSDELDKLKQDDDSDKNMNDPAYRWLSSLAKFEERASLSEQEVRAAFEEIAVQLELDNYNNTCLGRMKKATMWYIIKIFSNTRLWMPDESRNLAVMPDSLKKNNYRKLMKILMCYYVIKILRNESNHANNEYELMKPEAIKKLIIYEIELLESIPDLKKEKGVENE